jgi:hypothetical protein
MCMQARPGLVAFFALTTIVYFVLLVLYCLFLLWFYYGTQDKENKKKPQHNVLKSCRPVLVVEKVGENHRPWASNGKLYHLWLWIECTLFSSPCQRQCELLPSLVVCRPLTFHILIYSSETPQPNELKLGRKHLWMSFIKIAHFVPIH